MECPFTECGKRLSTRYKAKLHVKRCHLHERNYQCRDCLKRLKSSDSLKRHRVRHQRGRVEGEGRMGGWGEGSILSIPKLSTMLSHTRDIDFLPFVQVTRLYPFLSTRTRILLPSIPPVPRSVE